MLARPIIAVCDADGDGVSDDQDLCPDSDLSATVRVGACDTGVSNLIDGEIVNDDGCSLADLIHEGLAEAASGAANHGQFVKAVAKFLKGLAKDGVISKDERGAITACVAALP